MDTGRQSVKRLRKNKYSREQVTDWQSSGLSKSEYARQNGIHPNVLTRWIARYEEENGAFVRIEPRGMAPDRGGTIEIVLPDGIRIRGASRAEACEIVKLIRGL